MTETSNQSDEDYRGYLNGPSAKELQNQMMEATRTIGRHREDGALAIQTPRAMTVMALYAAHTAIVRYRVNGQNSQATGLVWSIEGNNVMIISPDNRPGAVMHTILVDSITSVEVFSDDGLSRTKTRVTEPSTTT